MSEWLFGPVAIAVWILASAAFAFCATWLWGIVFEVRGLFGTGLATIATCLAVVCVCFALILMRQPWIANWVLGALVSAAFPPIVIWMLVLTDLYAASRNGHRSFTAISYEWYQRVTKRDRDERTPRHPISLGGKL